MLRLIVRVVGTDNATGTEAILATIESDQYDHAHLDTLVNASLTKAAEKLISTNLEVLRVWRPEVSVSLTAEDEVVRPSLHLNQDTLNRLVEAGASFDFDPYV